jgi:hypothetical protein
MTEAEPQLPGQLPLFGPAPGLVGRAHPDTSHLAAAEIEPKSGTLRRLVLDYVTSRPDGATDLDIQRDLHLDGNTERPRRVELVDAGWLADSGERRLQAGRWRIIWRRP